MRNQPPRFSLPLKQLRRRYRLSPARIAIFIVSAICGVSWWHTQPAVSVITTRITTNPARCPKHSLNQLDLSQESDIVISPDPGFAKHRHVDLFMVIVTGPSAVKRRDAVRQSWLRYLETPAIGERVDYAFVVGAPYVHCASLADEQRLHNDIVFLPNLDVDSYEALPQKTIAALQWAHESRSFDLLLKVDDDVWLTLPRLLKAIDQLDSRKKLYWGRSLVGWKPLQKGKWKDTEFTRRTGLSEYPRFMQGLSYVLSSDVVDFAVSQAQFRSKALFEDVNLGWWLSAADLRFFHDRRFYQNDESSNYMNCSDVITLHLPDQIDTFTKRFWRHRNGGHPCTQEEL